MKISKAQKKRNRDKIISAAVDLIIKKGVKAATMRRIAQDAGVGDATIYNYFPTKEAIIYAYYKDKFDEVVQRLNAITDYQEFTFREQLQAFFETKLDLFIHDREFIEKTFKPAFLTFSQHYNRIRPIKDKFMAVVEEIFATAVESGEVPEQAFRELTLQMFWEYYIGVVLYWVRDDSDRFESTSLMVDKSMDLACSVIRAGIGNKIFDMGIFLFKNHVLSKMDMFRDRVNTLHGIKKEFREMGNG